MTEMSVRDLIAQGFHSQTQDINAPNDNKSLPPNRPSTPKILSVRDLIQEGFQSSKEEKPFIAPRGPIDETVSALGAGFAQTGQAIGGTMEMLGVPGGQKIREEWQAIGELPSLQRPTYLQQDDKIRGGDWRWWVRNFGENIPNFAMMYGVGGAAGTVAKIAGAGIKAISRAALAGGFGGSFTMEAGSQYAQAKSEMLEEGYTDPDEIERVATMEGLVAGTVNAIIEMIPMENVFGRTPVAQHILKRILKQGILEGSTESIQEGVNIFAEKIGHKPDQQWSDQVNRILTSGIVGGVLGGGIAGPMGATAHKQQVKQYNALADQYDLKDNIYQWKDAGISDQEIATRVTDRLQKIQEANTQFNQSLQDQAADKKADPLPQVPEIDSREMVDYVLYAEGKYTPPAAPVSQVAKSAKEKVLSAFGMKSSAAKPQSAPVEPEAGMTVNSVETTDLGQAQQNQMRQAEDQKKAARAQGEGLFDKVLTDLTAEGQQQIEAARLAEAQAREAEQARLAEAEAQKVAAAVASADQQQAQIKSGLAADDPRKQAIVDEVMGLSDKRLFTAAQAEAGWNIVPDGRGSYALETPQGNVPVNLVNIREQLAQRRIAAQEQKDIQDAVDAEAVRQMEERTAAAKAKKQEQELLNFVRRFLATGSVNAGQLEVLEAHRDQLTPQEIAKLDKIKEAQGSAVQGVRSLGANPAIPDQAPAAAVAESPVIDEQENPEAQPVARDEAAQAKALIASMLMDLDAANRGGDLKIDEEGETTRTSAGVSWLTKANKNGAKIDVAGARTVLTKAQSGEPLTDKQQIVYDAITAAAQSAGGRQFSDALYWAEQGFLPQPDKKLAVENMAEGDRFVIHNEEYKVTDVDEDGNVTLKDGTIKKVRDGQILTGIDFFKPSPEATFNPDEWATEEEKQNPEVRSQESEDENVKALESGAIEDKRTGKIVEPGATSEVKKVYRATDKPYNEDMATSDGIFVVGNKLQADGYAFNGRGVEELYIKPGSKILTFDNTPKELYIKDGNNYIPRDNGDGIEIAKYARDNGYDVVEYHSLKPLEPEMSVVNPKVLSRSPKTDPQADLPSVGTVTEPSASGAVPASKLPAPLVEAKSGESSLKLEGTNEEFKKAQQVWKQEYRDGKITIEELGRRISEFKDTGATTTKKGKQHKGVAQILDDLDNTDMQISDAVPMLKGMDISDNLKVAIADYEKAVRVDREEHGMRSGLPEEAEENLRAVMERETKSAAESSKKEPWQRTRTDFYYNGGYIDYPTNLKMHKESVAQAVAEGKAVPAEVLKDYPDLQQDVRGTESAGATMTPAPEQPAASPQGTKSLGARPKASLKPATAEAAAAKNAPRGAFPAPEKTVRADSAAKESGERLTQRQADQRLQEWKKETERVKNEEDHSKEVILSLFDRTGVWSRPYAESGYTVITYDATTGEDIFRDNPLAIVETLENQGWNVTGILSAPPCTSFSASGARWWENQHDIDNPDKVEELYGKAAAQLYDKPIDAAEALAGITGVIVDIARERGHDLQFYALENPVGRIADRAELPDPALTFHPNNYGDPYTKKTMLWGEFNPDLPRANVEPHEGSRIHALRGNVPEQKSKRSETPEGFAYAFFMANHAKPTGAGLKQAPAEAAVPAAAPLEAQSKEYIEAQPKTDDSVNIQDTGEKLGGARKDRAASFKKEYTDDDIASLPLSKIWPKNEADAIEDPFMAAFAHAARAAIPTKPQLKYKVSRWVERVKMFRQMMSDLFADIEAGTYDRKKMLEKSKSFPTLKEFFVKVRLLEAINRNQWDRIGEVDEHPDAYRYGDKTGENGKSEHIAAPYVSVYIDGRYKSFEGAKTIEEAIDKIKEALDKTPPTQAESIKSFEVRGSKDHYFINKKGDSQYHKLKEFTSAEEALNYRNEHTDELWKAWDAVKELENVAKEDVRHKDNRPRTGKDHRGGKDVTAQQFIDAFGFRGVEFGNWVAQGKNAKERQGMLNEAYDAIMDLADILGVPPKAISLNGTLGLGFGSRGQGWAAAHYEPDTIVINLTKTKGSGTFSHEFFHALDHYFQRKRSVEEKGREKTYITYSPETYYQDQYGTRLTEARYNEILKRHNLNPGAWTKVEGVRPEVAEAFKALVDALDASPMSERVSHIKNKYWSRIIERAARSFENYVIVKMAKQGYQNDYLANVVRLEDFKREAGRYPYLMDEEIAPIETAFDHLFETIQTRETDKGIELFSKGRSVRVETPISVEDANGIISRFLNAGKLGAIVRLNLADSFDALPDEIRQAAVDAGGTKDNTYGILHKDGSIWLIRDAHATPEQLEKSIFHEVFGHLGIFKLFGKDVIRELHVLSSKLGGYRRMAQIADKYGVRKDFDSYYNDAQQEDSEIRKNARATAELLALIGQKSPSLMQQAKSVWGAIRQALRKMGLISISKYNDTDLAYLLAEGKKALYKPGTAGDWTVLMTAWHGSPHDFDKFSKDKIGTGEGAQAYGYGLYFAGAREVAEFYKEKLAAGAYKDFAQGVKETRKILLERIESRLKEVINEHPEDRWGINGSANELRYWSSQVDQAHDKKTLDQIIFASIKQQGVKVDDLFTSTPGRLYQVELAPDEDEYLLWDKPLSEQSEKVKAALEAHDLMAHQNGDKFYLFLSWKHGSDKDASDYLHSLGIRGIKYLDGSSRSGSRAFNITQNKETGKWFIPGNTKAYDTKEAAEKEADKGRNYNYVIFDESDVEVTEKYSLEESVQSDAENFARQLDDYAAGKLRKDMPLTVGKTPYVLERLGAKQLPVIIDQNTVHKCLKDKHGLSLDDLKKITGQINDPIMVFDSASALERQDIQAQTTKNNDSFVVMTSITHRNKTVVVAIHLEKQAGRHIVNDVASVHPRSSDYHFLNWIDQGLLRYYHKGKARNWFMTRGLQLPKVRGTNPSSGNKILFNTDLVKSTNDTRYSAEEQADTPKRLDAPGLKQMVQDLRGIMAGTDVIEKAGTIWLKTASGEEVQIVSALQIDVNSVAINGHYSPESAAGKRAAGMFSSKDGAFKITLNRNSAGIWTLSHEFYHFLEAIGAISNADKILLNQKINALMTKDPVKYGYLQGRSAAEQRAEFTGRTVTGQFDPKTPSGKIISKIKEIIDRVINALGIRTAVGVIRDIQSGKVYDRQNIGIPGTRHYAQRAGKQIAPGQADKLILGATELFGLRYSLKDANGENTPWWVGRDIHAEIRALPKRYFDKANRDLIAEGYVPITRAEADEMYGSGLDTFIAWAQIRGAETTGLEGIFMRPLSFKGYGERKYADGKYEENKDARSKYWKFKRRYDDSQRTIPDGTGNTEAALGRDSATLREENQQEAPLPEVADNNSRYSDKTTPQGETQEQYSIEEDAQGFNSARNNTIASRAEAGYADYVAKPLSRKISQGVSSLTGRAAPETRETLRKLAQHFREFWKPFSTVPDGDKILAKRYEAMGNVARAVRFIEDMNQKMAAWPDEVKKDVFWYLNGDIPIESIPEEARDLAKMIRRRTEVIGEMLVNRGILAEGQFEKYRGKYVHYLYAKHVLGEDTPVFLTSTGKLNLAYTISRNPNMTIQQRKELGLIEDASVAVPVGMGKALTDIAKYDYLESIAENPDWVWQPSMANVPIGAPLKTPIKGRTRRFVKMGIGKLVEEVKIYDKMMEQYPSPEVSEIRDILRDALTKAEEASQNMPDDFVQLPTSKGYGALAGAFVRKPIADDLMPVLDMATDRGKLMNTLLSIERQGMASFKMGKVALNIPTAFRNIVSNIIQNNMRGRALSKIPGDIIRACESLKAKDQYYEEAFGMGLFHTNWFVSEINDVLDEFRKVKAGRLDQIMIALKNVAKYYGKLDDINKLAIFIERREAGIPIDSAALEAMKWGMDYSLTSRSIKGLRQTIMPFATYSYKIAPLIGEAIQKRPWVLAKYALLFPAAKMLAMALHDLDDDDWEDLEKQLPAYIKKSGSMMILPWKTDKDQWQWVNLEYFFPWGNMLAIFRDAKQMDSGEALRDLGISNPFLSMFYTGLSTREDAPPLHAYFGTPIYNELDPGWMKAAKYLEYMANTWAPSMLTRQGAIGYLGKAIIGDEDRWGRSVSLPQAAGRWFGLNIVSVSPEQSRAQVSVKIQDLHKEMSRIEANPSYSEEEKEEYRTRMNERLSELAEAAPSAVLPIVKAKGKDQVYDALKDMAAKGILHASPPSRSVEIGGIPAKMSMDQYRVYLQKSSDLARPRLAALVLSPGWAAMSDERKAQSVSAIVSHARKGVRQRVKAEMARERYAAQRAQSQAAQ